MDVGSVMSGVSAVITLLIAIGGSVIAIRVSGAKIETTVGLKFTEVENALKAHEARFAQFEAKASAITNVERDLAVLKTSVEGSQKLVDSKLAELAHDSKNIQAILKSVETYVIREEARTPKP